jgi:hypothetical protein
MSWGVIDYKQGEELPDAQTGGLYWSRHDLDGARWVLSTSVGAWFRSRSGRTMCLMSIDLDCWNDGSDVLRVLEGVPAGRRLSPLEGA